MPATDPRSATLLPDARLFEIAVRRLANALRYGQERSPFLGAGVEFVQSRPYQEGDPVRSIDWKVTARTGRFHVKEYEAPRQLPHYLLVDTSASMCFSSLAASKHSWAVQIAGGLALAALDHMNPVGLMSVGDRDVHSPPTLSRGRVLQSLHQLRRPRYDETTRLGDRVRQLLPHLERRALLVVLSDLHDAGALPAIRLAAQDHDCAVLQLADPAEEGRLGGGLFRVAEAERGGVSVSHGLARWHAPDVVAELRRAGIDHLRLRTDRPILPPLRHFLRQRAGRRRLGA